MPIFAHRADDGNHPSGGRHPAARGDRRADGENVLGVNDVKLGGALCQIRAQRPFERACAFPGAYAGQRACRITHFGNGDAFVGAVLYPRRAPDGQDDLHSMPALH